MVGLGRTRLLPTALVALILVSTSRADGTLDFGFYPPGAQDCLSGAGASSQCETSTVVATNSCLCRNGGNFITTAAACIGKASPGDLKAVYKTMNDACSASETPITITEAQFMAAANGGTTTTSSTKPSTTRTSSTTSGTTTISGTTTNSATTTATSTGTATTTSSSATSAANNSQAGQGSSGLSTGAMAGVIAGAVGGCAVLAAVVFFLFRRRRKVGEESHPMLPQHQPHHFSMAPSGHSSTAYYGSPPDTGGWPKKDWGPSPDLRNSGGFNWESPAHLSMGYPSGGGALAPSPPLPVQELDGAQAFPPGSTQAPVEMGGSPIATTAQPAGAAQFQTHPGMQPAGAAQYQAYIPGQQQHYPGPGWGQPPR